MGPKVFVSQPIPEPALDMLREVAEVTVFPRLDRNMSEDEWVMAAGRSDYLFVMGGNIITANVIKANPKLKGIAMVHRRLPANNSIDLDTAKALRVRNTRWRSWVAALDVFWHEPPGSPEMAPSAAFFQMDSVILAPHNGGATWDARTELTVATARQIVALIAGERPAGLVED